MSLCILLFVFFFFFFKQKTAYEIYQCDWSSDVCSSDLNDGLAHPFGFPAMPSERNRNRRAYNPAFMRSNISRLPGLQRNTVGISDMRGDGPKCPSSSSSCPPPPPGQCASKSPESAVIPAQAEIQWQRDRMHGTGFPPARE